MEQVMNVVAFGDHGTTEISYAIVILRQATMCRHCRKIIEAHGLAIRQTLQNRNNQYYHLTGCKLLHDRDLKQYIRLNLNVDGKLP